MTLDSIRNSCDVFPISGGRLCRHASVSSTYPGTFVRKSYFRISILSASLTLDLTKRRDDMVTNNLADVVADMAVEKVADL